MKNKNVKKFSERHNGPDLKSENEMLEALKLKSVEELIEKTIPGQIQDQTIGHMNEGLSEEAMLERLKEIAKKNKVFKTYLGLGYYGTHTPTVILRNIVENPAWYTSYTPYQAEISQGRLEALLNFQTMIKDLTGMEIANASLLDEGTAAAEAMFMCRSLGKKGQGNKFFISELCFPQTIDVIKTRSRPLGVEVVVGNHKDVTFDSSFFGALFQYPAKDGRVLDYQKEIEAIHQAGGHVVMAADILSLTLLKAPGEIGADIVVGSSQRFGVPMGYGGPHAGFMATKDQFKRDMPGRLIGVSVDSQGNQALRLALQTREQHIRREKATSNICTAQALLAIVASMYAVYHGPKGLKDIAERVHSYAVTLRKGLRDLGFKVLSEPIFDTVSVLLSKEEREKILKAAIGNEINLLETETGVQISLDETVTDRDVLMILRCFAGGDGTLGYVLDDIEADDTEYLNGSLLRESSYLTHPTFNSHHSETEMLRYIHQLQSKDISLAFSMIPLGSCTMKLNSSSSMIPITWPEFSNMHPFCPVDQAKGYAELIKELEEMLSELTGFAGVSLQPNSGAQGEYAGLLVIQKYHESRGEKNRNICLIPSSAHGTNPASAALAGLKVVVVKCDELGNVDVQDLREKATLHKDSLSCLMITYPSTHGVFEEAIVEICNIIHENGGQVYMDGANFNAQVGICRPGKFGPDVMHLNLHKTFTIPHGGGGPGVGPIGVGAHLKEFLPSHVLIETGPKEGIGAVSSAPFGSAMILPIPWAYIAMMGKKGLKKATELAILNANYMANRLQDHYPVLYRGTNGMVAHECIIDLRIFKPAGIEAEDVAKRLIDYGFHAPTMSFPVPGTLMIEPTESESKAELDRFCDAMIEIRKEIQEVMDGKMDREVNCLKMAPHTVADSIREDWNRPYSREKALFPLPYVKKNKFFPPVGRVNNPYGDKNLFCTCPPLKEE